LADRPGVRGRSRGHTLKSAEPSRARAGHPLPGGAVPLLDQGCVRSSGRTGKTAAVKAVRRRSRRPGPASGQRCRSNLRDQSRQQQRDSKNPDTTCGELGQSHRAATSPLVGPQAQPVPVTGTGSCWHRRNSSKWGRGHRSQPECDTPRARKARGTSRSVAVECLATSALLLAAGEFRPRLMVAPADP
jgi:hypothetical protein